MFIILFLKLLIISAGIFNKNPAKIIRLGFKFKRDVKTSTRNRACFA